MPWYEMMVNGEIDRFQSENDDKAEICGLRNKATSVIKVTINGGLRTAWSNRFIYNKESCS